MRILALIFVTMALTGCQPAKVASETQSSEAGALAATADVPVVQAEVPASIDDEAATSVAALPSDVAAFIDRRESCDHWRGEDAYNEARGKEILAATKETCTGSDAELARLRKAYKQDAAVIAALADYEDKIELAPAT